MGCVYLLYIFCIFIVCLSVATRHLSAAIRHRISGGRFGRRRGSLTGIEAGWGGNGVVLG